MVLKSIFFSGTLKKKRGSKIYIFPMCLEKGVGSIPRSLPITLTYVTTQLGIMPNTSLASAIVAEVMLYDILGSPQSRDLGHYNLEFQVVVRNLEIGMRLVSPPDGHSENHDWRSVSHVCQLPRQLAAFETYLMAYYDTGIFTDV